MELSKWMLAFGVSLFLPSVFAAEPVKQPPLALTAGTVVDVDTGREIPDATVLIVGERIVQMRDMVGLIGVDATDSTRGDGGFFSTLIAEPDLPLTCFSRAAAISPSLARSTRP